MPQNIHFRDFWSRMFCSVGSSVSVAMFVVRSCLVRCGEVRGRKQVRGSILWGRSRRYAIDRPRRVPRTRVLACDHDHLREPSLIV